MLPNLFIYTRNAAAHINHVTLFRAHIYSNVIQQDEISLSTNIDNVTGFKKEIPSASQAQHFFNI
jgi:hypothetical protein